MVFFFFSNELSIITGSYLLTYFTKKKPLRRDNQHFFLFFSWILTHTYFDLTTCRSDIIKIQKSPYVWHPYLYIGAKYDGAVALVISQNEFYLTIPLNKLKTPQRIIKKNVSGWLDINIFKPKWYFSSSAISWA